MTATVELPEVFSAIEASDQRGSEQRIAEGKMLSRIESLRGRVESILEPYPQRQYGGPETNKSHPHKETPLTRIRVKGPEHYVNLRLSEEVQTIGDYDEEPRYKTYGWTIEQVIREDPDGPEEIRKLFELHPHMVRDWESKQVRPDEEGFKRLDMAEVLIDAIQQSLPVIQPAS